MVSVVSKQRGSESKFRVELYLFKDFYQHMRSCGNKKLVFCTLVLCWEEPVVLSVTAHVSLGLITYEFVSIDMRPEDNNTV